MVSHGLQTREAGRERSSSLTKITQQVSGKGGMQTHVPLGTPKPEFLQGPFPAPLLAKMWMALPSPLAGKPLRKSPSWSPFWMSARKETWKQSSPDLQKQKLGDGCGSCPGPHEGSTAKKDGCSALLSLASVHLALWAWGFLSQESGLSHKACYSCFCSFLIMRFLFSSESKKKLGRK